MPIEAASAEVSPAAGHGRTAVLLALLAAAAPLKAADEPPWQLTAVQSVTAHHNLLRLGDAEPVPEGLSRDDVQTRTRLDGRLRLQAGRQQLQAQARWHDVRHARNPRYDHPAWGLGLALDLATADAWSGTVAAATRQALTPINAAGTGLLRDRRQERVDDAALRLQRGGAAQAVVAVDLGWRRVGHDGGGPPLTTRAQQAWHGGWALTWQPQGGASVGLDLRAARARHPGAGRGGDAVRHAGWGLDLRAGLALSGASRLDLRVGHGHSRWSDAAARDHDGPTASLAWTWQPTAASRLRLQAVRGHGQHRVVAAPSFEDAVRALDEVRQEDTLRLELWHRPGPRWALQLGADQVQRRLVRLQADGGLQAGSERATLWRLGLGWTPRRGLRVDCSWAQERQRTQWVVGAGGAFGGSGSRLQAGQLMCAVGAELSS